MDAHDDGGRRADGPGDALRRAEQLFRVAAQSVTDVIYEWDLREAITWLGDVDGLLGYPSGGFPRTFAGWVDALHPEDRDRVAQAVQRQLAGDAPYHVEYRVRGHDGAWRWWSARGTVLPDEHGKPDRWVGAVTDVTALKRAEGEAARTLRELAASEERFRNVFDHSTLGKSLTLPDGTLQRINGAFAEMLGYSLEELQNKNFAEVTHPDDVAASRECIRCVVAGERATYRLEKRYLHRSGQVVWADVSTTLLRDHAGAPLHLITSVMDITARKRAEEALREARDDLERRVAERTAELARAKRLLDETGALARVGGWELDLATNELSWTTEVYRIHELGPEYRPNLAEGIRFYAPEAVPAISDAVQQAVEHGRSFDLELPLVTAKGRSIWVRAQGEPRYDQGKVVKVGGAFQEITERKLAQDELERHRLHLEELVAARTRELALAAADLERSNKDLEQFAYVASHDLQEPLRMVSSFTQLLARRYEGQLDETAREYIAFAVDGAQRMQRLITDLLTYSRVGTRGKPLVPTDAAAVLDQARFSLQTAIEESGAVVTADALPTVYVDPTQLQQVFQNLLANALKFRGPDAPRVHVSARDRGSEWEFSVRDNGLGVDPRHAGRLFVIFQRLHTREEYPGTGIGLALCKRILERHGGRIWLESAPGAGSTFSFTVPKEARPAPDAPAPPAPRP